MPKFSKASFESLIGEAHVLNASPTEALAVTVLPNQQVIRVTTPASSIGNLVMPSVEEAAGRMYAVRCVSDGTGDVHIIEPQGSSDIVGDDISAAGDYVVMYCDGYNYYVLAEVTT